MGNVSSLSQWDTLFQALTTPEDLRAYLDRHAQPDGDLHKTAHLLVGTLHVDTSLLRLSEVAESFDTATFCLGQLVSHEPKIMSELPIAKTVVSGLSCALSKGWHVHHGVAKFAANSLTILCLCEEAVGEVRDLATTELLNGLAQWLQSEGELLV
mmetsp:Transcript_52458/g.169050  ORF Transcript_52458/g.169050 Transcript_52458/m.169050 type:complete len:155 (-) Transcript_52458:729-1193(-)